MMADDTRVYRYGAKPPSSGVDAYWREEREMHRLRNAIVEIERKRRERAEAVVRETCPEIQATAERLAEIDASVEEARARIKLSNARSRSRDPEGTEAARIVKELRAEKRMIVGRHDKDDPACACWKCRRRAAYQSVRPVLDKVDAEAKAAEKALYAERAVSWCDYNAVMEDLSSRRRGAPPRFLPWRGERGRVVVQIIGGARWEDLLSGVTQARVEPLPLPANATLGGRRSRRPWHVLHLRVGRDVRGEDGGEWIAVRFALHRPLPSGGRIQQVYLVRRRIGTDDEWSVQFAVRSPSVVPADIATAAGSCGVDLGWRQMEDGSLRVACLYGENGRREELRIPSGKLDGLRKADSLRSIRDREFDAVRAVLGAWLSEHDAPDWLRERTATMAQWRSCARLASVVLAWRSERFAGDDEIYRRVEAWRAQDKHLCDWESHQRQKFVRWREDLYRRFAARLRWSYETVVVEDTDWRDLMVTPPAEDHDEPERLNRRWWARAASPGRLRQCMEHGHPSVVRVPAEYTTRSCSVCGAGPATGWDAREELIYRCEAGHAMDQDENAARNLCAHASGPVVAA